MPWLETSRETIPVKDRYSYIGNNRVQVKIPMKRNVGTKDVPRYEFGTFEGVVNTTGIDDAQLRVHVVEQFCANCKKWLWEQEPDAYGIYAPSGDVSIVDVWEELAQNGKARGPVDLVKQTNRATEKMSKEQLEMLFDSIAEKLGK